MYTENLSFHAGKVEHIRGSAVKTRGFFLLNDMKIYIRYRARKKQRTPQRCETSE